MTIASDVPLPRISVSAVNDGPQRGDRVFSIGCGGGDDPSRQNIRVTKLNPYLGPDCLECTGVPIQGRSGGGLFNQRGEVIGVCVAADSELGTGLYAGLKAIHKLLKPTAQPKRTADQLADGNQQDEPAGALHDLGHSKSAAPIGVPANAVAAAAANLQNLPEGAEVICIIRSHDNPRETSRVIVINRASPKFMAYLRGEMEEQPRPTTARMQTANIEPHPTRRTAHFVDPNVVLASSKKLPAERRGSRAPQSRADRPTATATPSWRPATRTPTLAPNKAPTRYRRSPASR